MKYAKEQRLRFIDFLVNQYGYINRAAVIDYFDMSPAMVSRDFTEYREMAPNNLVYNLTKKTYLKSPDFERIWD